MATFTEEFTRVREDCDQAHEERRQILEDTRKQVEQMAHDVQEQLMGFRDNMQKMHGEIAEAANQVRTNLKDLAVDLKTGGSIFRKPAGR
jgi:hypothetical protein